METRTPLLGPLLVMLIACGCGTDSTRPPASETSDTVDLLDSDERPDSPDVSSDVSSDVSPDTSPPDADTPIGDTASDALPDAPPIPSDTSGDAELLEPTPGWRWERLGDLPRIQQEHSVLALDGTLYVLGGFQNLALLDTVTTWRADAGTFSEGPALPRPLHHLNAAAADGRLWVLGSLEGFTFAATGDAWSLDPAAQTPAWTPVAAMPNARRRGSAAVAVVGGEVFVIGGFRGSAVAECDVYRIADDRWDALPALPEARDHAAAAAIDGRVYLVGGRRGAIASVEANLWRFDPGAPELGWVALAPMPTARGGLAAGVVLGPGQTPRLVVVGGEGNPNATSGVFAEVESYDPASDTWTTLPPMPNPRHGMQAVGVGSTLFVPGGADVEAFGATNVFEALTWTGR